MKEDSAIWMFLSVAAICYTWHKVAAITKRVEPPARPHEISMIFNGKPFNGSMTVTADGKTSIYKIVDGKIA